MREHRHADPDAATGPVTALVDGLRPLDPELLELLRGATHQLRTPLTSVTGYLELLADGAAGPLNGEQARLLEAVTRNTARLAELIDALEP